MRLDVFFHDADQHETLRRHLDRRLDELERKIELMAKDVAELDTVLQRIEDATTKLGTDLKDVFTFIKSHPNVDLTAQIAKGDAIANTLIQADVDALAEENPLPVP